MRPPACAQRPSTREWTLLIGPVPLALRTAVQAHLAHVPRLREQALEKRQLASSLVGQSGGRMLTRPTQAKLKAVVELVDHGMPASEVKVF